LQDGTRVSYLSTSTRTSCCNERNYWPSIQSYACGTDTCMPDGTRVSYFTTSTSPRCCNERNYWPSLGSYACGTDTCIPDGTRVSYFITPRCCNGRSYCPSIGSYCCGPDQCIADGQPCWDENHCGNACCNRSFYRSQGTFMCGRVVRIRSDYDMTCSKAGTSCDINDSCKICCSQALPIVVSVVSVPWFRDWLKIWMPLEHTVGYLCG
jgi:hypothetical protein